MELQRSLGKLRGDTNGVVGLHWSGPDPQPVEWWIGKPSDCQWPYESVFREGTVDDVRELVDGATLLREWEKLYLPPHVRHAWEPLIDSAQAAV